MFTRKQHYLVLVALFLITLIPRLPFQGPYLYNGDPVAYFSGAESLIENGKYLIEGNTPIWPIGTSLTLVPFILIVELFGAHPESAAFWHGAFFIFIAVAFTYLIGKRVFNPATGIIGATLLSLAESPFINSINSASDPGAVAMLLGGVYLMMLFLDTQNPKDLFLSFFFLGLAFVFRWNYVFFLPLFLIYLIGDRRIWAFHLYPSFWILGFLGFLFGIGPQLVVNYLHFGNPVVIGYSQVNYSTTFVFDLLSYVMNIFRVIYRMLFTWDFFSPILAVFSVLAILNLWKTKRRDVLWLFMPWVVLGTLSVIYFGVKPRLLIPIMPPMFLLGAEGVVQIFYLIRRTFLINNISKRALTAVSLLMITILFTPMFARTILHAHGHYQDKRVMQKAFRWTGEQTSEGTTIITQPKYAGHNPEWLRIVGKDAWASKRYSEREVKSLAFPGTWKQEDPNWYVINRFWFEGGNLRFDDTESMARKFDSLITGNGLELKARFSGEHEPLFLKKLNMHTYYPVDFQEYTSSFEVWGPKK